MAIDSLYRDYFQKSKVFLYPLLGIKRGAVAIPEQTYLSWDGYLKTEDVKLITVYPKREDSAYINFENTVLLKHNRLCDVVDLNDQQKIFTFDFTDMSDDWNKFLKGQYSKMSTEIKDIIRKHFDANSSTYVYMDSYLFPEKYFSLYADLLNTSESLLREVGELCSPPNLEKENLVAEVIDLQNKKILG